MIFDFIIGCVLALVVVGCGVLALIIYGLRREQLRERSWRSTLATNCAKLSSKCDSLEKQSPVELAARVAELSDAVQRLAKTQQRFQGRFDQYVSPPPNPDPRPDRAPPTLTRDELRRAHAASIMPAGFNRE